MKITLVTVGKIKERYFEDAIKEYSKRLGRYCRLDIIQVQDEKTPDGAGEAMERQIKDKEGQRILSNIKDGAFQSIFGLDVIEEYRHMGVASRLMEAMIETAGKQGRKGLILTCKDRLIGYYEKFGYVNMGVSKSVHGGAVWYDMVLEF